MTQKPEPGTIGWIDLTVPDAPRVRDFYAEVAGWIPQPVEMEGYADFSMTVAGKAVAGVCNASGMNTGLPAQWLIYIVVADLDASLASVHALGGSVVAGPKAQGPARYAVIRDPAGAVCALYQP